MRFRLLRRRLTISAPRVAVRRALPWPFRWLALAVVFGLCAAVALWAFEFGKSIAGLDTVSRDELLQLRQEIARVQSASREQETVALTAESLLVAERAAKETLVAQVRHLEGANRTLSEDLGFFEKLIPATTSDGLAIRGFQAEVLGGMQLRWQVLIIQPARNAPEFAGRFELVLAGTQGGSPWTPSQPAHAQTLQFQQYRRLEGVVSLPPNAVVKTVTARVVQGGTLKSTRTMTVD